MNVALPPHSSSLHDDVAAALEWWRAAGVEHDFIDDATAWLETPTQDEALAPPLDQTAQSDKAGSARPAARAKAPAQACARIDFFADGKPETLEQFREFWMNAAALEALAPRGRVPPRGVAGAQIMVLVVDPEATDRELLLGGPQGRLAHNILAAAGVPPDQAYFASALPCHTPMADTQALAASGLGDVLLHHLALAAPKRVMAFGTGLAPLLGQNVNNPDRSLREINQSPPNQRLILSEGLDALIDMPRLKARFWRRWIEWSAQE